ncbi:unnamed protein product [Hapterophycus canaliculatus]
MAGVDAAAWMESFKGYLEPVAKVALDVKEKLESYEYPPAIVDAYKSTAAAVGAEDISPVYVGVGVVAASGFLLLACRTCQTAPKKKKGRGSKKSKAKAKPISNGSSRKNGGSGMGAVVAAEGSAANGGSGTRGLAGKQPKIRAGGSKAAAPQPAKKAPAKTPQPQGKGKGKGKPIPEAPPVITEEPEAATKKVSKKKEKAAKKAKAAAAAATAATAAKKASKKGSAVANGSALAGAGSRQAHQNGGGGAAESDPWGAQHAGGEWQTGPIGPQEGEWETVSHKRSKPRKERTVVDDANAIPGGLGL